jgi:hypothetical protein
VEDWAEIRRLYRAEGLGIKTIARTLRVRRTRFSTGVDSSHPRRECLTG